MSSMIYKNYKPIPIGKIGLANREARKRIAIIAENKGLNRCEIGMDGCTKYIFLAPAHRHKRDWYKGSVEKLSDFKQWVCGCQHCHEILDRRTEESKKLTEEVFMRLRGKE